MSDVDSIANGFPEAREPSWTNTARQLSTAWLTSFGQAINALSRDGLPRLFHDQAVVFGASLYGPCAEFDALHFALDAGSAKIAPLDHTYTLITVGWLVRPVLAGSPTEHGDATFVLYTIAPRYDESGALLAKGRVTCVHAHYSRRAAEAPAVHILKGRASN